MDAHEAFQSIVEKFETNNLDSSIFLQLSEKDQLTLIDGDFKEISHIKSVKNYPELESDPNNVIFEDKSLNRSRLGENMTEEEERAGLEDFIEDIKDGDINEDGIVDLQSALDQADNHDAILDIIGLALPIGLIMSGVQVVGKVKNNEIVLNQAPKEYVLKVGEQSIKVAAIGTLLASGSPVLVGSTTAFIIYKSRKLWEKIAKGIYRGVTSDTTKKIISTSGKVVVNVGKYTGKTLKYTAIGTYNVATHQHTKNGIKYVAKGVAAISKAMTKLVNNSLKGTYKIVTHDVTRKSIKGVGKTIVSTGKVGIKAAKSTGAGISKIFKIIKKKKNV